jgi:hypothetical protein
MISDNNNNHPRSGSSMSSDMDNEHDHTGSHMQSQGVDSPNNGLNDATMSNDPQQAGNNSNRMNGVNEPSSNSQWDNTGGDTYNSRQETSRSPIGEPSGEESVRLGGPDNSDFDGGSHSQESASDDDDFNTSGFEEDDTEDDKDDSTTAFRDKIRSSDSKTFNEDEASWKNKKDGAASNPNAGSGAMDAGSGAAYGTNSDGGTSSNKGTSNNNWDATNPAHRGREIHGDDEEKNADY